MLDVDLQGMPESRMARCQNFLDDTEELCVEVDELALTVAASDLRWAASDAAA